MSIRIGSAGRTDTNSYQMNGMAQGTDSYIRNIQRQIANAQKRLQELSSNKELSMEEKMKKGQEIQQQITDLNNQLRQYQMEQRREQQNKRSSDNTGGGKEKVRSESKKKQSTGMSQTSMKTMISADSSLRQAEVSGNVAAKMEGRAGVLKAEIKQDQKSGVDTRKKEEELAEVEQTASKATARQMGTLNKASAAAEETRTASSRKLSSSAQEYLRELKEKYPDVNITVADFRNEKQFDSYMLGSSGFNNIVIASNIIEQMANDPAAAAKYEKVIADVPRAGEEIKADCDAMGIKLIACGARIDEKGKVTYWGVAEGKRMVNPGTVYKEKVQKQLEQKRTEKRENEALEKKRAEVAETKEKLLEKIRENAKSDGRMLDVKI